MRFGIVAAILSVPMLGCSGGPKYAAVSGRITLDGKPLRKAAVAFLPKAPPGKLNATGPGSSGLTDENGSYVLYVNGDKTLTPGAVVGEHRVSIITALTGKGNSDSLRPLRELLPSRYNAKTELCFTVDPGGTSQANFELRSSE